MSNSNPPFSPAPESARQIRTVIVDDEPVARRRLRSQLAAFPDLVVVGEHGDGESMIAKLQEEKPALVFMDIHMPGQTGIDIARLFPEGPRPVVVFVTAYEEHAFDAFSVQAADYLLKPVSKERLAITVERLRLLCAAEAEGPAVAEPARPAVLNRLVVPAGERMIVVSAPQIDWIESAGNYAVIHVGRDTHVLRETLTELDERLAPGQFMRISRSVIVNLDRIRELRSDGNGGHLMVLADGTKLAITRGIREVQKKLETGA